VIGHPRELSRIWSLYKAFYDSDGQDGYTQLDTCIRLDNGSDVYLKEEIPSLHTYDIIHFTNIEAFEAGISRVPAYPKRKKVFAEARFGALNRYRKFSHFWQQCLTGIREDFGCCFLPWFLNPDHRVSFKSDQDRYAFEDQIPDLLVSEKITFPVVPGIAVSPYSTREDPWQARYSHLIDFTDWVVETEHLKYLADTPGEYPFYAEDILCITHPY